MCTFCMTNILFISLKTLVFINLYPIIHHGEQQISFIGIVFLFFMYFLLMNTFLTIQ